MQVHSSARKETLLRYLSQMFSINFDEFRVVLRFVSPMNLMLILCYLISTEGREPFWCDFAKTTTTTAKQTKQTYDVTSCSDIYRPISFNVGLIIETTKFYILSSVWMTVIFTQDHSCMRNQKGIVSITSQVSLSI